VRRLLRHGADANARSADGITALMHATVVGDVRLVRLLLDHRAEVNARNRAGATALMWAVGDRDKVRALLDRGADVNARADSGHTPLLIAAGSPGAADVVKLLLEKGADARYAQRGYTVLMAAAGGGDREVARLLLARGADVKATNRAGWTALHAAALAGDPVLAKELLARGADVNARDTIQHRTPLLWAAAGGRADLVKLLLDHGADTRARESLGGATALICAAASERGDPEPVKLLLERGADRDAADKHGECTLDWARRRGSRAVVKVLEEKGARGRAPDGPKEPAQRMGSDNTAERAVAAALLLLQRSSETFVAESGQGCVSCHHQSLPALAIRVARERGLKVDEKKAHQQTEAVLRILGGRREQLLQGAGVADRLDAAYWLAGLDAAGVARNDTTDALVHYLTLVQAGDGRWRPTLFRPPSNISDFTATALAVRGLQQFCPPGRRDEIDRRVGKARGWLLAAAPRSTEDRTFRLLGLTWADAPRADLDTAARGLLAGQRKDGGWAQHASAASDAYATGQALVALAQSGTVSVKDAVYRRGVRFLLDTQLRDGSWLVQSRSLPVQPYFESGFPHGRSQFIACAATSWATMALALTVEPPGR
jgi:ankyrin repeat protein